MNVGSLFNIETDISFDFNGIPSKNGIYGIIKYFDHYLTSTLKNFIIKYNASLTIYSSNFFSLLCAL